MNEPSPAAKADDAKESNSSSKDDHEAPASESKTPASKDKQCPYCNQSFTSSSLGRHLDQYLFKKKPDGIHDVEEIRRIRSGITRRTARGSSKQDSPEDKSTHDPHSAPPLHLNQRPNRVFINQPSWHSTGVINDIPNSASISQLKVPSTSLERSSQMPGTSHPETAKALELALREVLDSIKAASARTSPRLSPFEFDLQSQTFPALCLQALPPPPSLFSTHPFPCADSFPLDPPTFSQREIVQQALRAQIQQWKSDHLVSASSSAQSSISSLHSNSSKSDTEMVERTAHQHEEMILRHLDLSLKHWMDLSPMAQRDLWQLEITRAFSRESEKRKKVDEQLSRTQQEVNQLRSQLEKLASCQWPREFALFPPNLLPISPDVARDLDKSESVLNARDSARWDYDNMVSRWKRVVMHDKSMGRTGVGALAGDFNHNEGPNGNPSAQEDYADNNNNNNMDHGTKNLSPHRNSQISPLSPMLQQPYSRRQYQSQSTINHSPPYETVEPNEATDISRPPKRIRTRNGQVGKGYYHPDGETSPKNTWNPPPGFGAATTPAHSRTNTVLSPSLPGAPLFPINSTAPPTPPATATVNSATGEITHNHNSSVSSTQPDTNNNDKQDASPRTRYTPYNHHNQHESTSRAEPQQQQQYDSANNIHSNTNKHMKPMDISSSMPATPSYISRSNDPQHNQQQRQSIYNDSNNGHSTQGILNSSSIYASRPHSYAP